MRAADCAAGSAVCEGPVRTIVKTYDGIINFPAAGPRVKIFGLGVKIRVMRVTAVTRVEIRLVGKSNSELRGAVKDWSGGLDHSVSHRLRGVMVHSNDTGWGRSHTIRTTRAVTILKNLGNNVRRMAVHLSIKTPDVTLVITRSPF